MASCSLVCLTVLIYFTSGGELSFIKVDCDKTTVGRYGHQTVLMCVIRPAEEITDVTVRVVIWEKEGKKKPLLFYGQEKMTEPGYSFAETSWNNTNMNVSLLISTTKVADDGVFKCSVVTDSGVGTGTTTLNVKAKYSSPTVELVKEGKTPKALHCHSTGGYPAGELRWFDGDGTDWTPSSEIKRTKMDNGLFNLSSKFTLLPKSTFSKYTCVLFNSSRCKEEETTLEIAPDPEDPDRVVMLQSSKVVAPLVVIGSLIVGLLALLLYRKQRHQIRRPSTTPLMGLQGVPTYEEDIEEGAPQEEGDNGKSCTA